MMRVILFLITLVAMLTPAVSAPIDQRDILVIEGDLIRIQRKQPDVTLLGINAPEVRRAQCRKEKAYGEKAARRLREIVRNGNLDFELAVCACPPDKIGTKACNNGRHCGRLRSGGRDVSAILVAEGLAVPFQCGETSCPRPPRPWCKPVGLR